MTEHANPLRAYALVLAGLLVLTGVTTGVAFVDLGAWNTPVALGIAATKAALVGIFFMHLAGGSRLTLAVVVSAFVWFAVLVTLTLSDYLTRRFMTFG